MKARLIGFVFVFGILAALFVLTGGDQQSSSGSTVQPPVVSEPSYGNLKIQ